MAGLTPADSCAIFPQCLRTLLHPEHCGKLQMACHRLSCPIWQVLAGAVSINTQLWIKNIPKGNHGLLSQVQAYTSSRQLMMAIEPIISVLSHDSHKLGHHMTVLDFYNVFCGGH